MGLQAVTEGSPWGECTVHGVEFGVMAGHSGGPCWPSGLWGVAQAQGGGLMRVLSLQYAGIKSLDHIDSEVSVPLGTGPPPSRPACALWPGRGAPPAHLLHAGTWIFRGCLGWVSLGPARGYRM